MHQSSLQQQLGKARTMVVNRSVGRRRCCATSWQQQQQQHATRLLRARAPTPPSTRAAAAAAGTADAAGAFGDSGSGSKHAIAADNEGQEDEASREEWRREMRARVFTFLGPALVMPLGEPLMNVVDTVCLGQWAGTAELAAMGPALIVFAFAQYVFQALQISTVTLISEDLRTGRRAAAQRTLSCALAIAVAAGLAVGLALELFAEPLIAATGADAALAAPACAYIRIRALAQPAVLATMVLQAALLAQQDSLTPALTTAAAVAVSLAGNCVAVGALGLGILGAAGTTVATQLVAVAGLVALSARAKDRLRPALALPTGDDIAAFGRTMGPLAVAYVCKNCCYLVLQTAAAGLDTLRLAAHQAVFSFWNLLAFTTAPLEQISLAFVPAAAPGWRRRETAAAVLCLGAAVGVTSGLLSSALPLLAPGVLTRDAAVWPHIASVAGYALAAMLLTAADVAATGILLASRDLRYVAQAFTGTLAALFVFMTAQARPRSLTDVWAGLVFFFGMRLVQSGARLAYLWRRGALDREDESSSSSSSSSGSSDATAAAAAVDDKEQHVQQSSDSQQQLEQEQQQQDAAVKLELTP